MRKCGLVIVLLFVFCYFPLSGNADSLVMGNNQSFPSVIVDSYSCDSSGAGSFAVRMLQNGQISDQAYGVPASDVHSITFISSDGTSGCPADMVMTHGGAFENVTVLGYEHSGEKGVFRIREAGKDESQSAFPVDHDKIQSISFKREEPSQTPYIPEQTRVAPVEQTQPSAATPQATQPQQTPQESDPLAMLKQAQERDAAREKEQEQKNFFTDYEETEEEREARRQWERNMERASAFAEFGSSPVGRVIIFLVTRLILAVLEGIIVWLSVKSADETVPIPKAMLTGLLLSIFPGLLMRLCFMIPVPFFNFMAGLAVWYYSARAIIMGMVEVLEDKATQILIYCVIFEIGFWVGILYLLGKSIGMIL